ncbi:hypothetical protein HanXRQr2_Chr09g0366861 [Helianthus annuus]|uniref:Uncharacterized protein n=1 Tax=Helianthus annuus TaxID=4232 RepID=A0A9K3I2B6_HELAN|nr:hypothetical protein HanXRQr2_Chr09g0366861 [Helianthus annuus]KAJ0532298.1 hypothetical protein HanIR_Chr09g0395171 [Helianthus annuus]KAJ0705944.1 hypothetical protein HanLR1_Chr09g0301161 [Helianthus annuus]KAJ0710063.1 hypothetical protein HanOQP8_Chr09g0307861 [Helianthus annuus]KAJ0891410.1 hypothetical protein HanPSC8_Chr09g0353401 [Helianthus annuus]
MADTKTIEAKISIKVIVDKAKKRVVYVEADHSFVDILFSFMTLPMGTIVRLLEKHDDKKFEALGSLNNLYQSLKDFPDCYLSSEECKRMLLNPRSLSYDHCRNLQLQIDDTEPTQNYVCRYLFCQCYRKFMSANILGIRNGAKCSRCNSEMALEPVYWCSNDSVDNDGGVFVSDIATFIVTDDLCVEPYTSAITIRLLTDFGITDMNHLEERNL